MSFFDAPMIRYFTDDSDSTESSDEEEEFRVATTEMRGRKRKIPTRSSNPTLKVPKIEDDSKEPRRSPRKPGVLKEVANISLTPPKKRPSSQNEPVDPPNPYSANIVNDRFQRLMRDYIDLYFYMYMPDRYGFCQRPTYQPFMHRNLAYMRPDSSERKRRYNRSTTATPRPMSSASDPKSKPSKNKFCWETDSNKSSKTSTSSTPTFTVKFSYIRHSDLPGHRTAKIQLFIATETDGSYAKIEKLPSACFDMPMNEKLTAPISIDLPPTVNLELEEEIKTKCHYLITRVSFSSGTNAMTSSGRSLRNVPARQAMLCDKGRSLRHSPNKGKQSKDDEMLMFGAKQITEITEDNQEIQEGDGGVVLIETDKLNITGDEWKTREDIIPELLRLGKKFHSNPFINLSVEEDSQSNDSSNSSDSDSDASGTERNHRKRGRRALSRSSSSFDFPRIAYQFAMESDDFPANDDEKLHHIKTLLLENDQKPQKQDWVGMFQGIWAKVCDLFQDGTIKKPSSDNGRFKENHRNMLTKWEDQDDDLTLPPPPKTYMIRISTTPQKCYFCHACCFNLMALLKHLKLCHPRFNFVYRPHLSVGENRTLPGITVTLDPFYDGSNEINPMAHYIKTRMRGPQQRPANNIVTFLVFKNKAMLSRKIDKNMKLIAARSSDSNLTSAKICDRELKMIYFDERHRHPTIPFKRIVFENDGNAKSINHSWLSQLMKIKIDEIKDLLNFEKEFMLLWNRFLLESRVTAPAVTQLYRMCRNFLDKYRDVLFERSLFVPWTSHISFLAQKNLLDWSQVYDLIMRTEGDYDPLHDPQHIIAKYKHKLGQKGRGMESFEEMVRNNKNMLQNGNMPSLLNEITQSLEMAETGSSSSSSTSTSMRSSLERDIPLMVQQESTQKPKAEPVIRRPRRHTGDSNISMFL